MKAYYTDWPEGLPCEARKTRSRLKSFFTVLGMQIRWLFHATGGRRIRHAESLENYCDPYDVEKELERAGAIPPQNGWPKTSNANPAKNSVACNVTTHSVI